MAEFGVVQQLLHVGEELLLGGLVEGWIRAVCHTLVIGDFP